MLDHGRTLAPHLRACSLQDDLLNDAWDHPIYYAAEGTRLIVVASGPDGRFTTPDDIGLPRAGDEHVDSLDVQRECAARPSLRRPPG
jgi:hypothetical protein